VAAVALIDRCRQQPLKEINTDLLIGTRPLPMEAIGKLVTGSGPGLCARAGKAYSQGEAPDPGKCARA